MRLLFISGALRRNGSTEGVINNATAELLSRFKDVEIDVIYLCDHKITMCDSCYTCDAKRECWIPDDMDVIVKKMLVADGIIYAFPVNAFGVNSLMQIFLERAGVGYLRFSRPLENKVAGILVTGRRYGHEMAWAQVALNVVLNRMILIGSGFPSVVKNDGKVLGNQIQDQEGRASVEAMLEKMVWFLRLSESAAISLASLPMPKCRSNHIYSVAEQSSDLDCFGDYYEIFHGPPTKQAIPK